MTQPVEHYFIPADRYYDAEHHMWARPVPDSDRVVIGIDALAIESMGDLAYVVLHPPGTPLTRGKSCGSLEAAKMTGELFSPVTGTVVEVNRDAMKRPSTINADNYDTGWLLVVRADNWADEAPFLVSGSGIPAWAASETARYREQGWAR
jgi:glycine cleavage system H protein